ncbi:MAG: accessory factor UbiK family protein [Betaproteobacteria bacterium]|nr:accessory factor UbiK family protein [Betaproteobacteria bacterium]
MTGPSSALNVLADLAARLDQAVKDSPLADVERNVRAQFIAELAQRGLVTREEYEVQVALLDKTRAKLAALEARLAALDGSAATDTAAAIDPAAVADRR